MKIESFDDSNYDYEIEIHDGWEHINLIPVVSEEKLNDCSSTGELLNYLETMGIRTRRTNKNI